MNPSIEEELEMETQSIVTDEQQTVYQPGEFIDLSKLPLISVQNDMVLVGNNNDLKY